MRLNKLFTAGITAVIDGVFDRGRGSDKDRRQESDAMLPAIQASMVEMLRPAVKVALATWL